METQASQRRTYTRVSTTMQNGGDIFVIINYSATKLSVGRLEILGWMASFLQSSRILLPHSTPGDKLWNNRLLQTSTQILFSRSIHGFKQVQRPVVFGEKVFTLQLTKCGDISRTSVCPLLITPGLPYRIEVLSQEVKLFFKSATALIKLQHSNIILTKSSDFT